MAMRIRQLQRDVNEHEQAELRRLEGGSQVGADMMQQGVPMPCTNAAEPAQPRGGGAVVSGAVQRSEQLSSKFFANGGFRESAKIVKLLPRGGAGLKAKVPKRLAFGDEGEDGDDAHSAAMKDFGILEFGSSHVKGETIEKRMNFIGLFGHWLQLNKYGKYVEWQISHGVGTIYIYICSSSSKYAILTKNIAATG